MVHTIEHLKDLLRKRGVKGYSGKKKAELEKMCKDYECFFAQEVMEKPGFRKGALTRKARGKMPLEFAKEVLANPEKHDLRTRRQAQFLVNIQKK
jgi:hypothetical protein